MKSISTYLVAAAVLVTVADGEHHMKRKITPRQSSGGGSSPLLVSNWCAETIYPGVVTQAGDGPDETG